MTRMHAWRTAALIAVLVFAVLALVLPAMAQSTGGSFGGGDWGGGGGGSSGGGGGGYSSGGSRNHDGGFFLVELVLIAFRINPIFGLLVLGIVVAIFFSRVMAQGNRDGSSGAPYQNYGTGASPQPFMVPAAAAPAPDSRAWMGADVTQVRLALDVAARPQIEAALDSLMRSVDVRTRHGLLLVVHRVAGVLRENERAWRLGGESNYHPMSPPQAAGVFQQLAAAGRARAAASVAASTDPSGVFFITLLVAAKREIVDFQAHRPEQMRMILDDLGRLTEHDLVSAEVYWLPLRSGTGMSVDEVRRLHPDMKPIEHGGHAGAFAAGPAAPMARAPFCPHCGKQMLLRLPHCEHCGAPRLTGS